MHRRGLIVALLFASLGASAHDTHDILDYRTIREDCRGRESGRVYRVFRSFRYDGHAKFLGADVETFETRLLDPARVECGKAGTKAVVSSSRYGKALIATVDFKVPFAPSSNVAQNGFKHASSPVKGTFLTADLCPASHELFEHRFFDELESIATKQGSPVPIALAVSGGWLRHHDADFEELLHFAAKKKLDITWVNHSDTHPYVKGLSDELNFLLEPGLNPETEVTGAEIELLKRGQLPSVFFRYPGLVSSARWNQILLDHSLIPISADAWLALGGKPTEGGVILVHGNGNEPLGISIFFRTLSEIEALGSFLPITRLF